MQHEIDLSGLRDLHPLPPPPFWPLAIGWWILFAFLLVVACLGVIGYWVWKKRPAVYACKKARQLALNTRDDLLYLKSLSQLLKRVAIAAEGRLTIAPLSDSKWQNFLHTRIPLTFSESEAHLIAFAPYESNLTSPINRQILTQHTLSWIKKILKDKKSS